MPGPYPWGGGFQSLIFPSATNDGLSCWAVALGESARPGREQPWLSATVLAGAQAGG